MSKGPGKSLPVGLIIKKENNTSMQLSSVGKRAGCPKGMLESRPNNKWFVVFLGEGSLFLSVHYTFKPNSYNTANPTLVQFWSPLTLIVSIRNCGFSTGTIFGYKEDL